MALLGSDSSDYAPPYAVPRLPKMGDPSGGDMGGNYSPPYIGGSGDPNAGRIGGGPYPMPRPPQSNEYWNAQTGQWDMGGFAGPPGGMPYSPPYIGGPGDPNAGRLANGGNGLPDRSNMAPTYGSYLGWDQGKLNDPTHNTPKYQFLRAMLDAGISSQNRDLTGAVSALQARGYPVSAVPGSSDQIKWGDQGTYDIFNGTNGDFLFGEQGGAQGQVAPQGMPPMSGQPSQANTAQDLGLGPWNGSSYGPSLADSMTQSRNADPFGGRYGAYQPPYMNGAA